MIDINIENSKEVADQIIEIMEAIPDTEAFKYAPEELKREIREQK